MDAVCSCVPKFTLSWFYLRRRYWIRRLSSVYIFSWFYRLSHSAAIIAHASDKSTRYTLLSKFPPKEHPVTTFGVPGADLQNSAQNFTKISANFVSIFGNYCRTDHVLLAGSSLLLLLRVVFQVPKKELWKWFPGDSQEIQTTSVRCCRERVA